MSEISLIVMCFSIGIVIGIIECICRYIRMSKWYELNGNVYIYVNEQGTLEKHSRVKWYKVIALAFLQFLGKNKHLQEIRDFLK